MINKGFIKRVGNQTVDVQLAGSAATLPGVALSGQIDRSTLVVGMPVLVDTIDGRPLVLHTVTEGQRGSALGGSTSGSTVTNNALLADGSVPLMGNLTVMPGATVDGYDISVLGQTIDNLQAADSVARTGYTVLTHASHLVATIGPDDSDLLIRHGIFTDKETLTVSNTVGEIEFMRVVGDPVPTVDDRGALCYRYTVTRRIATNPGGIVTGWAAATLINGLTHRGYISIDARDSSEASPNLRFVLHTDIDAGATEHIVRLGNVRGILGNGDDDYGFAVGRLTTGDRYFAYNYNRNLLALRGADMEVSDPAGVPVFRVWGVAEDDHEPGNTRLGKASGGHLETVEDRVDFYTGSQRVMTLSPTGSRFRGMIWSGDQPGPQVGIGEDDGQGLIAARNAAGVGQFVVRTGDENVHVHVGNPVEIGGYAQFADGNFTTDGIIRARAFELLGGGSIGSGVVLTNAGRFTAGTGNNVAVIDGEDAAWRIYAGHATPASAPFRVNQAGEAWLTNAHVSGEINATAGVFGGWTLNSTYLAKDTGVGATSAGLAPNDYPMYAGATYANRATAPFRVTPAGALTASNADITGTVNATAGNFTGSVYVGAAAPRIHINGANKRIESTNFASGTSGFRIEGATGNAEFNNVTVRGALTASVIQYGYVLATNGSIWVVKAAGRSLSDFVAPKAASAPLDIEDPDGMAHVAAGGLWIVGDIIRLQEPLSGDFWGAVTAKTDMTTYWRLTVEDRSSAGNGTFPAGATVLNYGVSGDGVVRITADASNSPYLSIATHAGSPWTTLTERARLGNLAGISGASGYGLWTDNGFFTGTINANAGNIAGWNIAPTKLYSEDVAAYSGVGMATYQDADQWAFWAGSNVPANAEFRVNKWGGLYATSATITGTVTANTLTANSGGSIAGWTISSGHLYSGTGSNQAGMQPATYPFYAGSDTPSAAPFRVTPAGALTATSATITGTITANTLTANGGGAIAGWTISSGHLYAGSGAARAGLQPASYPFYAGSDTPGSAPFRVTPSGALTATSGVIGGWTLSSTKLSSSLIQLDAANNRIQIGSSHFHQFDIGIVELTGDFRVTGALAADVGFGCTGFSAYGSSFQHMGNTLGFYGATAITRPAAYTFTNGTADRAINCDSTTVAELADVVYTMWNDLKSLGLLQ